MSAKTRFLAYAGLLVNNGAFAIDREEGTLIATGLGAGTLAVWKSTDLVPPYVNFVYTGVTLTNGSPTALIDSDGVYKLIAAALPLAAYCTFSAVHLLGVAGGGSVANAPISCAEGANIFATAVPVITLSPDLGVAAGVTKNEAYPSTGAVPDAVDMLFISVAASGTATATAVAQSAAALTVPAGFKASLVSVAAHDSTTSVTVPTALIGTNLGSFLTDIVLGSTYLFRFVFAVQRATTC